MNGDAFALFDGLFHLRVGNRIRAQLGVSVHRSCSDFGHGRRARLRRGAGGRARRRRRGSRRFRRRGWRVGQDNRQWRRRHVRRGRRLSRRNHRRGRFDIQIARFVVSRVIRHGVVRVLAAHVGGRKARAPVAVGRGVRIAAADGWLVRRVAHRAEDNRRGVRRLLRNRVYGFARLHAVVRVSLVGDDRAHDNQRDQNHDQQHNHAAEDFHRPACASAALSRALFHARSGVFVLIVVGVIVVIFVAVHILIGAAALRLVKVAVIIIAVSGHRKTLLNPARFGMGITHSRYTPIIKFLSQSCKHF